MAANRPRQDQIKSGDAYDDDVPAGASMEAGAETLQDDLNAIRSQIKRLGGAAKWYDEPAGGGAGWLYVGDITVPSGTATNKDWEDPPDNTILQEATVSSLSVVVSVRASYPKVMIGATPAALDRDVGGGYYSGTVSVTLPSAGDLICQVLTPDGELGAFDTVSVLLDAPPNVTAATFTDGAYPGVQTEVNADQTMTLEVVADKQFDQVIIANFEAGAGQATAVVPVEAPPGVWTASISVDIADRGDVPITGQAARVSVRDATTLAVGPTFDTDTAGTVDLLNVLTLNDGTSGLALTSISYPLGQAAVKGVETAYVNHTRADPAGTVAYLDPTGTNISIANLATFEGAKEVTCLNPLLFNNSSTNFRVTATKTSNGKVQVLNVIVVVADVAPAITVTEPAARLRSGGSNGTAVQPHTITLASDQPLAVAPLLNADSGGSRGAFAGVWAGGPSSWTRVLSVSEVVPAEKGTFAWEALSAEGLAGLTQTVINGNATYVLGGFVSRTLTIAPFADGADIDTEVSDFNKLTAVEIPELGLTMVKQPIGTAVQADTPANESKRGWYTVDATGINPTRLLLLHQGTIDGNAAGMTIMGVQETV